LGRLFQIGFMPVLHPTTHILTLRGPQGEHVTSKPDYRYLYWVNDAGSRVLREALARSYHGALAPVADHDENEWTLVPVSERIERWQNRIEGPTPAPAPLSFDMATPHDGAVHEPDVVQYDVATPAGSGAALDDIYDALFCTAAAATALTEGSTCADTDEAMSLDSASASSASSSPPGLDSASESSGPSGDGVPDAASSTDSEPDSLAALLCVLARMAAGAQPPDDSPTAT
jgi:hypothetical protein